MGQMFPKNSQWRHGCNFLWKSIPHPGSSDRKSLVTNCWN